MLHSLIIVLLLGLGDSLNPATLGPAMYLATVDHPRRALTEFLVGFVVVNVLAGVLILVGPGELLLALIPKPSPTVKHIIEVVAGVALIGISVGLWTGREALGRRKAPTFSAGKRSGVKLGAGIAAIELPTALPYFAALVVIVESGASLPGKLGLLLVYNAAFLAPVVAILITLLVLGDVADEPLARANRWVLRHWPGLLAALAGALGLAILVLGLIGLLES
jgi:cytochrome c biogenesis protein CcdA